MSLSLKVLWNSPESNPEKELIQLCGFGFRSF
jgi:hypothetical protein